MFMLEAAPPGRRMFFASWQLASQNIGSLASGLIGLVLALLLLPGELQRLGLARALRARCPRRPRSASTSAASWSRPSRPRSTSGAPAPGTIVARVLRENWTGVLLGLALISGGTITQYFLITITPYAIRTLHLPESTALLGTVALGVSGGLGALAGGVLADRLGIRTSRSFRGSFS